MSDAAISKKRGKTFEPRPDFQIEAAPKRHVPRDAGERNGHVDADPVFITLPRVRWLERPTP